MAPGGPVYERSMNVVKLLISATDLADFAEIAWFLRPEAYFIQFRSMKVVSTRPSMKAE